MAHTVTFTLDVRHTSDEKLAEIEKQCKTDFARIAKEESEKGCDLKWEELVDSPAVVFHEDCVKAVQDSAEELCNQLSGDGVKARDGGKLWKHMVSGAGHDSCYTNRRCPTSMIFTETKEGVSHNPKEYCSPENWCVHIATCCAWLNNVLTYVTVLLGLKSFLGLSSAMTI